MNPELVVLSATNVPGELASWATDVELAVVLGAIELKDSSVRPEPEKAASAKVTSE